jgi:hypothetical protein
MKYYKLKCILFYLLSLFIIIKTEEEEEEKENLYISGRCLLVFNHSQVVDFHLLNE